jgi:hypothetical protein
MSGLTHLVVSRRGIVHVVYSLDGNASTACGKGSRDLVYVGAVGILRHRHPAPEPEHDRRRRP